MGNAVEEGPDVKIDHPVLVPTPLPAHGQSVMGGTPPTVAVAVGMEDRLQLLLQQHRCRGLGHPVHRVRHPEGPDPRPVIFRYLHRPHRPREIAPRSHPVPQLVEVVPPPLAEHGDADGVHTGRTTIRPDPLPRPPPRGACRSQTTSPSAWVSPVSSSPQMGWPRSDPGLPGPFAPAPLQSLHRYYRPVRPSAPHRYSAPQGVPPSAFSLSRPGGQPHPFRLAITIETTGSPVPCRSLRRAHATSTPGTATAASRQPPG